MAVRGIALALALLVPLGAGALGHGHTPTAGAGAHLHAGLPAGEAAAEAVCPVCAVQSSRQAVASQGAPCFDTGGGLQVVAAGGDEPLPAPSRPVHGARAPPSDS